jgi:hypothetical protein
MFDVYLLFVPLLVLPIVLLLVFVGCKFTPPSIPVRLIIRVKFRPARQDMERFKPVVEIRQDLDRFGTSVEGPILLADGDAQFVHFSDDFTAEAHAGICTIRCSVYLDNIAGSPLIGPISCGFEFSESNHTADFIIDNMNQVNGCLPDL